MNGAGTACKTRKASTLPPRGVTTAASREEELVRAELAEALHREDASAARRIVRRMVGIDPRAERLDLESRLWETCAVYSLMFPTIDDRVAARRETRVAFDHSGAAIALLTLQAWAKTRKVAHKLAEARLGELTCERVILDHPDAFEAAQVVRARRWCVEHHVPLPATTAPGRQPDPCQPRGDSAA